MPAEFYFKDLPSSLVNDFESSEEFLILQRSFFIFLKKINADLKDNSAATAIQMARAFVLLRYLKDEFVTFDKQVKKLYEEWQKTNIPEAFKANKITNLPLDEGFRVETSVKLHASIKPNMQDDAFEWLRQMDLGDIIKLQVNPKTLSSALSELLIDQSVEAPDKIFTTFMVDATKCVRTGGKKSTSAKLKAIAANPYSLVTD